MKTSTVYHAFAQEHEALTTALARRVREAAPVQALYLLGLTTGHRRTETLFSVPSATRREVTHVWLLALVEEDPSAGRLQEKIETCLQPLLPVTAAVFSVAQFSAWLSQGHPFAAAVHEKAVLLFQRGVVPLPGPAAVDWDAVQKENSRLFLQTRKAVQEFLAGAELYTLRVQYKLAVFLLHQAAEQALRTMLVLGTAFASTRTA